MTRKLSLSVLPETLSVCRLGVEADIPAWATRGRFFSVTRAPDELSIVCEAEAVPLGVQREEGWRALVVAGPLDFGQTGILASLAAPLAAAHVSIFALSTYDTDYLLVRERDLKDAVHVLREAGHKVKH